MLGRRNKRIEINCLSFPDDFAIPVSYTHLDVYKRQALVSPVVITAKLFMQEMWSKKGIWMGLASSRQHTEEVECLQTFIERSKPTSHGKKSIKWHFQSRR